MISSRCIPAITRGRPQKPADEDKENTQGPSSQDLRHALVHRSEAPRFRFTGRQVDHMGCLHHKQSARHTTALLLGHDLRLRPERELRRLRWS